jgi:hypothetical protein
MPFIDGRVQLKQNLAFLLRVASPDSPFEFLLDAYPDSGSTLFSYSSDYVYTSYYDLTLGNYFFTPYLSQNELTPFQDNYLYRNFVFSTADIGSYGNLTNGLSWGATLELPYPPKYLFQGPATNGAVISGLLSSNASRWTYYFPLTADWDLSGLGVSYSGGAYSMKSTAKNLHGLPYVSAQLAYNNGSGLQVATLNAGGNVSASMGGYIYPETAQPQLETVDYYFTQLPLSFPFNPALSPVPGQPEFDMTNTTPLLIAAFGDPYFKIGGWAKQQINNGSSGKYAYLGQYFDKACTIGTNGVATTNSAGVLSAYGNFFPTLPGPAALVTLPDIDPPYQSGTGVVQVIKLQLDVNHDGVMDLSFGGPDNTSQARPFVFWVNNDNDGVGIGKDAEVLTDIQFDYKRGHIRSRRNLEDFARLWICGLPKLPTTDGYTITLSMSGDAIINLYAQRDTIGSIAYLSETNAAEQQFEQQTLNGQVMFDYAQKLKTINASQSYTLPVFSDGTPFYARFLFEGAGTGSGQLTLTISQTTSQGSNVIAQTSAWIDLRKVRTMYEEMVIQNNMFGAISNWSSTIRWVANDQVPDISEVQDTIVFVHGINVSYADWEIESDTVFKRLYWSGYRGKFATVKWPCEFFKLWTLLNTDTSVFNRSEIIGYKAGAAMKTYVDQLHTRFPNDRLHLLVHSQGNTVVGEAIKQGAAFDTYILTQGALPASAYDVDAPTDSGLVQQEAIAPTPEWHPMGYRGIYTNLLGRIVNFYNPNDPVLEIWLTDQGPGKPDGYLKHLITPTPFYSYDGSMGWHFGLITSYLVTDPQESRAMISRSRTESIGRQGPAAAHGVIQSAVNLNAQYGFDDAFPDDHSAQWAWPIQTSRPYFQEVLRKCQINPAP